MSNERQQAIDKLSDFILYDHDGQAYPDFEAIADWLATELRQARIDENESFKSIFEDAATWAPKCFEHKEPSSYCHGCKKRRWFAELSKEVIPIIDERLTDLNKEVSKQ